MIPPRQVLCLRVAYTIPHPNNVFSFLLRQLECPIGLLRLCAYDNPMIIL